MPQAKALWRVEKDAILQANTMAGGNIPLTAAIQNQSFHDLLQTAVLGTTTDSRCTCGIAVLSTQQ
jgi:acetylornithine/succinyldiaminopimelate/putrescine aminotransferase